MEVANERQTRKLFDLMDAGETGRFAEVCAEDIQISNPFLPGPAPLAVFQGLVAGQKAGFPNMKHQLEGEAVCSGQYVVFRGRFVGRNTGPFNGAPPTGNEVDLPWICIDEYNDRGRLAFRRVQFNPSVIMDQLKPKQSSIDVVKGVYEAFGKGDIPFILSTLAPDCEWVAEGEGNTASVGVFRGPEGAQKFFTTVRDNEKWESFEAKHFFSTSDPNVFFVTGVAIGSIYQYPKAEWHFTHLWKTNSSGQFSRVEAQWRVSAADTAKVYGTK